MAINTQNGIKASEKPTSDNMSYVYAENDKKEFVRIQKDVLRMILGVATKISELNNDMGFVDNLVDDLKNYYLKSETYSKGEIDDKLSLIPRFLVKVVPTLPTENISETTVYLVPSGEDEYSLYTEYINVDGLWEILGTQKYAFSGNASDVTYDDSETKLGATNVQDAVGKLSVDMTKYALKTDLPTKTSELQNDSNFLTSSDLSSAVNTALVQAKESGEFDGKDGQNGKDGTSVTVTNISESTADGGSNVVTFSDGKTLTVKNGSKGSQGEKGEQGAKGETGAKGDKGDKGDTGADGKNGTDATVTTENITKALGYTPANEEHIPTVPKKLPNPNALTFTGAVEGTYDGSLPLSLAIPSGGSVEVNGDEAVSIISDGTAILYEQAYTFKNGLYILHFDVSKVNNEADAGQVLYCKIGSSGVFADAFRTVGIVTVNNNFTMKWQAITFMVYNGFMYVLGATGVNLSVADNMGTYEKNPKYPVGNVICFYSQSSKTIPSGCSVKLYKIL